LGGEMRVARRGADNPARRWHRDRSGRAVQFRPAPPVQSCCSGQNANEGDAGPMSFQGNHAAIPPVLVLVLVLVLVAVLLQSTTAAANEPVARPLDVQLLDADCGVHMRVVSASLVPGDRET